MNKELKNINEISGLEFMSAGRMPRHSGSGKKRSLPLFNIRYRDVVPEPVLDYSNHCNSPKELQDYIKQTQEKWEGEVYNKVQEGLDKLEKTGYIIEDPILMTYVYKYSAYFIYKEKV